MKKNRFWIVPLVLCLTAVAVWAEEGPPPDDDPPPMGPPPMPPKPPAFWEDPVIAEMLGLSSKQVADLESLAARTDEQGETLHRELGQTHGELERLFRADSVDAAKVRQVAAKLAELEGRRIVLSIEHRLGMQQILTAKQRERLQRLAPPPGMPPHPGRR